MRAVAETEEAAETVDQAAAAQVGISAGVLWKGSAAPTMDSQTQTQTTVAAKGGAKGLGANSPSNDGIDGVAQAVVQAP